MGKTTESENSINDDDVDKHVEIPRRLPNMNFYDQPRDRFILCVPFIEPDNLEEVDFEHFTEEGEDFLRVTTLYQNGKAYSFVMETDEQTLQRLNEHDVKLVDIDTFGQIAQEAAGTVEE